MRKKIDSDFKPNRRRPKFFGINELSALKAASLQLDFNHQATVDGCRGIIDYYENLIKLRVVGGTVVFLGKGLSISSLSDADVIIEGQIDSIEFITKG